MDKLIDGFRVLNLDGMEFNRLKTIQDKINYCMSSRVFRMKEQIDIFCPQNQTKKSDEMMSQLKKVGNQLYVNGKMEESLDKFNDALRYAPSGDEAIPKLYGNRSACLFKLKMYHECIANICSAFSFGYPVESKGKLLVRKITSHVELNEKKEATEDLDRLLKSGPEILKKFDKEITFLKEKVNKLTKIKDVADEELFPPLHRGQSPTVPQMSAALEIKENKKYGRHIIAKEPIKAGCTLMVEEAFAAVLMGDNKNTFCGNCFRYAWNPVMCDVCTHVVWCSAECQNNGNLFHRYECALMHFLVPRVVHHLALRTVTAVGWDICMKAGQKSDKQKLSFHNVNDLLTNFEEITDNTQLQYCTNSIVLAYLLIQETDFAPFKERSCRKNLVKLSSILVENICRVNCNCFCFGNFTFIQEFEDRKNIENIPIGAGIFPAASMLNHSCEESAMKIVFGKTFILRSIRDIESGSQVYINYGMYPVDMVRSERQEKLKSDYFFNCDCIVCADSSGLKEAALIGFNCPKCGGIGIGTCDDPFLPLVCKTCNENLVSYRKNFICKYDEMIRLFNKGQSRRLIYDQDMMYAEDMLASAVNIGTEILCEGNYMLSQFITICFFTLISFDDLESSVGILNMFEKCLNCAATINGKYSFKNCILMIEILYHIDGIVKKNKRQCSESELSTIQKSIEDILIVSFGKNWRKLINYPNFRTV